MWYVGVDLSKKRWLAIGLKKGSSPEVDLFPNIAELWEKWGNKASLILIDIPIGLPEKGEAKRLCDVEARKLIGKRRSSVFPVPCRNAVYAKTPKEANKKNTPKKLSKQSWGLVAKIREVDELLLKEKSARVYIRETHPEVCFWALNNYNSIEQPKKEIKGLTRRRKILAKAFPYPDFRTAFRHVKKQCEGKRVKEDDILDALVAAVTATKIESNELCFLSPQKDSRRLHMEIVYPKPPNLPCHE